MSGFGRDDRGVALLSGTPLRDLLSAAGTGTPAYVYDLDAIAEEARQMVLALGSDRHLVAYAMKANSAGSIVRTVAREGAGTEVVSRAELEVALGCGISPDRILESSVGKADHEIDAAIGAGIRALQIESVEEVPRVAARARALGRVANVSFRVNPGVTIDTHAHVATGHDDAKFGVPLSELGAAFELADASPSLRVVGVGAHVGSTLKVVSSYLDSAKVVASVARARLATGKSLDLVDFGGGFGIDYGAGPVPRPAEFLAAARDLLVREGLGALSLVVEPGRSMVAAHGVLVARVIQEKRTRARRWAFIDAAMNDLVRPALYGAHHRIEPLDRAPEGPVWRVAGPVCESADDFGEHWLGDTAPDLVVIRDAGAYGFTMASEYNGRPLPAEIFVASGKVKSVSPSPGREAWVSRRLRA
jgi:diaminopimelate decarboxylase